MMQPPKLAPGLGPANEIILRTIDLKAISLFLHHPSISGYLIIHPSFIHPSKPDLYAAASQTSFRPRSSQREEWRTWSHHSSIIHPSIRARFVWCTLTNLASGLGSTNEMMLKNWSQVIDHSLKLDLYNAPLQK